MGHQLHIRPAIAPDAQALSRLIVMTLRETNARDYAPEIIARLVENFSPERVAGMLAERGLLVAVLEDEIVGSVGLQGSAVRTLFVAPRKQGQGIGTALMREIERIARERGIRQLKLSSSITAETFYQRIGFSVVTSQYHGNERTIVMEKALS